MRAMKLAIEEVLELYACIPLSGITSCQTWSLGHQRASKGIRESEGEVLTDSSKVSDIASTKALKGSKRLTISFFGKCMSKIESIVAWR